MASWKSLLSNLVSFVMVMAMISGVDSLKCYRCDGINQARSDCPGWRRRPIDTIRDLGDMGGLYTHCVDVRLENGTVLYQNTQSLHPMCIDGFLQMWRQTLIQEYKTPVKVLCCDYDRCNGPNAGKESIFRFHQFFTVILLEWILIYSYKFVLHLL